MWKWASMRGNGDRMEALLFFNIWNFFPTLRIARVNLFVNSIAWRYIYLHLHSEKPLRAPKLAPECLELPHHYLHNLGQVVLLLCTSIFTLKNNEVEISLVVQWLRLHLPRQRVWVWSLITELRSHMHHSENIKTWNRSNMLTNSMKTWKMVHIKWTLKT